jgi:hypothetical protein
MHRRLVVTALAGVLLLCVATPASAQAPGTLTLTFTELNKGSTFGFIDNPPKARLRHGQPTRVSAGDMLVFSSPLRDSAGRPFGRLRATCFITRGGSPSNPPADCWGVYGLPTGQLWGSATTGAGTTKGAILGGTGAFADMHGTFVSTPTKTGTDDTITLVSG